MRHSRDDGRRSTGSRQPSDIVAMRCDRFDARTRRVGQRRQSEHEAALERAGQRMSDLGREQHRRKAFRAQVGLQRELEALRGEVIDDLRLRRSYPVLLAQRPRAAKVIMRVTP